ncbi:MAG: transposase family protein, partial [Cytophagales bacterium]|nr:transposase family protein [Cytophagales bacterium]
NKWILTCIDAFSKFPEAFPLSDATANSTAKVLVESIICRYGAIESILTDAAATFCSQLVTEICRLCNIKQLTTAPYHPQTNAQVERFHQSLHLAISFCVDKNQRNWDEVLPFVLYSIRTAVNDSTNHTPFHLLYGQPHRDPISEALNFQRTVYQGDSEDYTLNLKQNFSDTRKWAREANEKARSSYKHQYDKKMHLNPVEEGDLVLIRNEKCPSGSTPKYLDRYVGPYKILSKESPNIFVDVMGKSKKIHMNNTKPYFARDDVNTLERDQVENSATQFEDRPNGTTTLQQLTSDNNMMNENSDEEEY